MNKLLVANKWSATHEQRQVSFIYGIHNYTVVFQELASLISGPTQIVTQIAVNDLKEKTAVTRCFLFLLLIDACSSLTLSSCAHTDTHMLSVHSYLSHSVFQRLCWQWSGTSYHNKSEVWKVPCAEIMCPNPHLVCRHFSGYTCPYVMWMWLTPIPFTQVFQAYYSLILCFFVFSSKQAILGAHMHGCLINRSHTVSQR